MGVHVGRIFKYLLFAAYHGKFTVCLQLKVNTIRFTAINLLFDLLQVLQSNNGGKKVGNTAVNGKLLLTFETLPRMNLKGRIQWYRY